MNPENTPSPMPEAGNKKPLLILVAISVILLLAGGVFYVQNRKSFSFGSSSKQLVASKTPAPLSPRELVEVQNNFKKNFRPGCSLDTPTDISFASGRVVSAYFAKCNQGFAQKSYKAGTFAGKDAVMEVDQSTKGEVPLIVVMGKSSANGSSTVVMMEVAKAQADYFAAVAKLTQSQKESIKNTQMHTGMVDGYVVLFNVGRDGPYFDESSMHVK